MIEFAGRKPNGVQPCHTGRFAYHRTLECRPDEKSRMMTFRIHPYRPPIIEVPDKDILFYRIDGWLFVEDDFCRYCLGPKEPGNKLIRHNKEDTRIYWKCYECNRRIVRSYKNR